MTIKELINYYKSGQYFRDMETVLIEARDHLYETHGSAEKQTLILDVDDTALSSFPGMLDRKFKKDLETIYSDIHEGNMPAVVPTLKLYQFVKTYLKHIQVAFITARPTQYRAATVYNLHHAGFNDPTDHLLMFPKNPEHYKERYQVKEKMRARLTSYGHEIIANIGDQESDLKGDYSGKPFKLPNPFYTL